MMYLRMLKNESQIGVNLKDHSIGTDVPKKIAFNGGSYEMTASYDIVPGTRSFLDLNSVQMAE